MKFRRGKLISLLLLICFAVVSVAGCGGAATEKEPVTTGEVGDTLRLGAIYPLTGPLAKLGQEEQKGAQIAADLRNDAGGINGNKIEWIFADAPTPEAGVSEAERLITVEKVPVIMGSYSSGVAYAASAVAEKNKVIYWENSGVADNITQRGFKYLFRFGITGTSLGETTIKMLRDVIAPELGKDPKDYKIGVIWEDSSFGTSVGQGAIGLAKELGYNVVFTESYSAKTTDLSSLVMKLKQNDIDILIPTSYVADGLLLFKQMQELNFVPEAVIMGGNATQDLKAAMGEKINGLAHSDITQPRTNEAMAPGLEAFMKEYKERYGSEPYSGHVIRAYAGANVLFDVLEKAGSTDADKIAEAARSLDLPLGSTAAGWGVKFAPEGDPMMGTNERAEAYGCIWYKDEIFTVWPVEGQLEDVEVLVPWPAR
ncbi:MAG: ABC transporter substrate-binding protein [Syntrophomonadaceae bacterium]|jgi:branched-chain amino acid transport system substrate-binding protein|nr:ABC transporter substrate-binding protein [Syntrophomonadaceae bacterium]